MSQDQKFRDKVMSGQSDNNISFAELCQFLVRLGFIERVNGSHHIFTREGVVEIINIQAGTAGKAKAYQIKQIRGIVTAYAL